KGGYCLPTQGRLIAKIKPVLRPLLRRSGIHRRHIPSQVKGTLDQNFSADHLKRAVEQSLRRLRSDYIDLYQLHSPPRAVLERGGCFRVFEELKQQGKIRHYGVSCESAEDALLCLADPGVSFVQLSLSLLHQCPARSVIHRVSQSGLGVVARQCFASGMLAKPFETKLEGTASDDQAQRGALSALANC